MIVRFTPAALADIEAVEAWYEQRSPGLATRFGLEVERTVDRIRAQPELYQRRIGDARRAAIARFPDYGLWYRVLPDHSLVIACVSGRRHEAIIRQRVVRMI